MRIKLNFSGLTHTSWSQYAVRFLFGGAITVIAGVLANRFGPAIGGLFLAFPAIFPASATLIEKDERQRKRRAGIASTNRGRQAAALDARGTVMGGLGLACFAVVVWKLLPIWNAAAALFVALGIWLAVSIVVWHIFKVRRRLLRW
jgi:hypothetical protein